MEAAQPFFEPAMIGIDIVDGEVGASGLGFPGAGKT
jgi:hypothetical protein